MRTIKNYLSLVKFSHTIFAMPFALIGFFSALRFGLGDEHSGKLQWVPGWGIIDDNWIPFSSDSLLSQALSDDHPGNLIVKYLVLVILCMVFARSAAMAFNRYLDRKFDAMNPRTAVREIPSGIIHPRHALLFTIISSALFIATTFFINRLCFFLSPVALGVILGYSYTKRFTPLCHLILGLGLSLAPLGAYLAVTGAFSLLPILFSITVLFWVSGFDIIYALQDEEFDRSNKLFSIPAWLGKKRALYVSKLLHLMSTAAVVIAGWYGNFGWFYWAGTLVFAGMLVYQHSLVKPQDLRRVNLAFMTANGIASVIFAICVIADMLFGTSLIKL